MHFWALLITLINVHKLLPFDFFCFNQKYRYFPMQVISFVLTTGKVSCLFKCWTNSNCQSLNCVYVENESDCYLQNCGHFNYLLTPNNFRQEIEICPLLILSGEKISPQGLWKWFICVCLRTNIATHMPFYSNSTAVMPMPNIKREAYTTKWLDKKCLWHRFYI